MCSFIKSHKRKKWRGEVIKFNCNLWFISVFKCYEKSVFSATSLGLGYKHQSQLTGYWVNIRRNKEQSDLLIISIDTTCYDFIDIMTFLYFTFQFFQWAVFSWIYFRIVPTISTVKKSKDVKSCCLELTKAVFRTFKRCLLFVVV